jgi:hypothetical protein
MKPGPALVVKGLSCGSQPPMPAPADLVPNRDTKDYAER